jgi:GTP:adenosylcobinamide-phosphate guanylyltransferase
MLNVIIQAGGRGTRMRYKTWNKPKCLLPYNGKPVLYHIFEKFPDAQFLIISDYKKEVLENYLSINNPHANYKIINSYGNETCSGIKNCLEYIGEDEDIVITWSDIIFQNSLEIPNTKTPAIYRTNKFPSRYEITDDKQLLKKRTTINGVAGIFFVPDKKLLTNVDDNGSFMKWFLKNMPDYNIIDNQEIIELGDFEEYEILTDRKLNHRFFNSLTVYDNFIIKQCFQEKYKNLINKEIKWYKEISKYQINNIPKIINDSPYTIEKIKGFHLFESDDKIEIKNELEKIIDLLKHIHSRDSIQSNYNQIKNVYVKKTLERVKEIKKILPFNDKSYITINGKKCENIFFNDNRTIEVFDKILKNLIIEEFNPIHGDASLSNIIISKNGPYLIDPRGYFDIEGIWGDARYDFAKLYFSCVGKYDIYNKKDFILHIGDSTVEILFQKTKLEFISTEMFNNMFTADELKKIQLIHSLIWLSMSAYAIEDVDSIIASHYLGLFYLEKCFGETNE